MTTDDNVPKTSRQSLNQQPNAMLASSSTACETDVPSIVQRYRASCCAETIPDLRSFLANVGALTASGVAAVLRADINHRWSIGRSLPVEWYFDHFPVVKDDDEGAIDLIYAEYLQREKHRLPLGADEYYLRFPEYQETLRNQFELHRAIQDHELATVVDTDPLMPITDSETARFPLIPGYEILEEIGRGGIGAVYKSRDLALNRLVAIKFLLSGTHASAAQLQRFHVEAEAAARLHHRNIVQVFEIGEYDGKPFLVLEYVAGGSLADCLRGNPQPARSVATIVEQLARAVGFAHQNGVIHRDLKPANVLLSADSLSASAGVGAIPLPKITDFGLAKITEGAYGTEGRGGRGGTFTGDIFGTPSYMSPEQAAGRSHEVGIATDVYSLGAILYELLTGRPPFSGATPAATLRLLSETEPLRPERIVRGIPEDIQTICLKCLEKNAALRYDSADSLAEDLARFLANMPIRARRISTLEHVWRWCRRNPLPTGLSAAIAMLMAALAIGASVAGWIRTERDRALVNLVRAEHAEAESRTNLSRTQQAERDAKIRAHLTQAIVNRKRGLTGHRVRSLYEIDQAIALMPSEQMKSELRDELIASLAHTDLEPSATWNSPHAVFDIDPAFKKYARATADGMISVRQIGNDRELHRFQRPVVADLRARLLFSPDGRLLASFAADGHLMVWDTDSGKLVLDDIGCVFEFAFDFTHDSRALVVGREREVVVIDLQLAAITARWKYDDTPWVLSCAPDGQRVAVSAQAPLRLDIHAITSGDRLASWNAPAWVYDVAWHPNNTMVAVGCGQEIHLWEVDQPAPHKTLTGSIAVGLSVEFSSDGSLLASSNWGSTLMLWEPVSGELLCSREGVCCLRFSHDDRQIGLCRDGSRVGTYNILRSPIFRYHLGAQSAEMGAIMNGGFSADGQVLYAITSTGLGCWDFATGHLLAFTPTGPPSCLQIEEHQLFTGPNVLRWPIRRTDDADEAIVLGPPEALFAGSQSDFSRSRDGTCMAVATYDGATIVHSDPAQQAIHIGPHVDCRYVAVHPDGQWIATGSHWGTDVKIWDSTSGRLAVTLPVAGASLVRFSPDGRWLSTTGSGSRLWKVGTWEAGPIDNGIISGYSPDGTTITRFVSDAMELLDATTAVRYARLEHPRGHGSMHAAFSPDGTSVVGVATGRPLGFVWDLQQIREELSARGLDWDRPPFPTPKETQPKVLPRIKIVTDISVPRSAEETAAANIAHFRRAFDADPESARNCNELAWFLATAPEPHRKADEAVALAEKATQLEPDNVTFNNTLGVAYYKAGQYRAAVRCLSSHLDAQDDRTLPYDLYFLAMSYHQLGESQHARDVLVWANRCINAYQTDDAGRRSPRLVELRQFQAEAESLIATSNGADKADD